MRIDERFSDFSGTRTTLNNLMIRNAQSTDLNRGSWTPLANLVDHQWTAKQTLGIIALSNSARTRPTRL